ncbi:ATP-grasp fold amidoligase family protein [Autumnicola musiva]|uniref:ATP-grasp fold amidoligase family protein n=1 Tax=Autumnicola musiva TaxID=3075589 RepID=A0ABU3D374_9FLAO|nr:ATP-grasp fold amidoligase family protein [Zunongwangia sp. F117]MDT0675986.1 ATP-grasp fold amidoligase family protein [Zunongwangia sp. F117]
MNGIQKISLALLKKFKFLPANIYLKYYYEYYNGKKLDLKNPVDFNEKIQWLKAYYHVPVLNKLVDKYEVREYVKDKIGGEYLNEVYGVYEKGKDVPIEDLPEQFVLKATHGYNFHIIVRDKAKLSTLKTRLTLKKWQNRNQFYRGGMEWAYKDVPKRILAEKYLEEIDNKGLSDIKFYCFSGRPEFIEVTMEIDSAPYRMYFDLQWKKIEMGRIGIDAYEKKLAKPPNLEQMVEIAGKLSEKFPFVRVDLYNIKGKILFGELTFYPADGRHPFHPEKYNKIFGDLIRLPEIPPGQKVITEL